MLKRICLNALLLVTFSGLIHADTLTTTNQVTELTESFMTKIKEGKTTEAYTGMHSYLGVNAQQFEEFGLTANDYMLKVKQQIGTPLSFDLLSSETIKSHFLRQTYLLKYEQAALVWRMTYYNAHNGWKLVGIDYSTDIEQLYKLSATN